MDVKKINNVLQDANMVDERLKSIRRENDDRRAQIAKNDRTIRRLKDGLEEDRGTWHAVGSLGAWMKRRG